MSSLLTLRSFNAANLDKTWWKMPKCQNSNATFWVIFKQCVTGLSSLWYYCKKKVYFMGFGFWLFFLIKYSLWGAETNCTFFGIYSSKKASLLWMSFFFCLPTSKAMPSLAEKKSLEKRGNYFQVYGKKWTKIREKKTD